ncbi:hypothetical protein [Maridesulfovibrio frigidus]|uniref:hypothetical protein n=1 Tax=Maridesulfovibrio frigidus TaxID=340956 RepID=UPI0004E14098|nr:hypothetical protein [Maridesulfovibrio frigidus]
MEMLIVLISIIVFAFIIYSVYSGRNSKLIQRERALELKEAHMNKSMDRVKAEITAIENEIKNAEAYFGELSDDTQ